MKSLLFEQSTRKRNIKTNTRLLVENDEDDDNDDE
jgi:hypothetical protein